MSDKDVSLEEARRFWSARARKEFTLEETLEMMERLYEFFRLLAGWKRRDDETALRDKEPFRKDDP